MAPYAASGNLYGREIGLLLKVRIAAAFIIIVDEIFMKDVSKPKDTQNCFSLWLRMAWRKIIAFFHGKRILQQQLSRL